MPIAQFAQPTPATSTHARMMERLSLQLDGLKQSLPGGSRIAYLDYPLHFNVGDLLINLGAERFFTRNACEVMCRMSLFELCDIDWSRPQDASLKKSARTYLDRLPEDTVLVLHGGGNFGDIYPEYQAMREQVAIGFPTRRIVMLPQSVHFNDPASARRSLDRMLAHRDLHLFLRDVESLHTVREASRAHGSLMPDMAHALWATPRWTTPAAPGRGTLVLGRTDSEAAGGLPVDAQSTRLDWPDLVTPWDGLAFRAIRKAMYLNLDGSFRRAHAAWYRVRDRVVDRARDLFSSREQVVTDRLHGLILASLLAKPVAYSDNSYGKLSRYAGAWLRDSELLHSARH